MEDNQRFLPLGGLNMDEDPVYIKDGDYTSGKNIRHLTNDTESTQGIIPIKGNTLKFTLPLIVPQNKVYRVYFLNNVNGTVRQLNVFLTNGQILATIIFSDGANIAATQATFKATATSDLSGALVSQSVAFVDGTDSLGQYTSIVIFGNYIPFADANVGYDYSLVSSATNPLTLTVVQEAIPASLSGQLQVIGSFDLLEDLYIFSTPETKLPEVLSVHIIGATNPTPPTPITITTDGDHGLSDGTQVSITGVLGQTGANGKWTINVTSSTTFELINSIATGVFVTSPDAKVNLYTESIGQIGVMKQDVNADTYPYFGLLTSKEFGFRTKKQIDSFAEKNNIQTDIYWTDDFNLPRVFYYSGEYLTDGALNYINPLGKYEYGNIATATALFINQTNVKLSFTGQPQTGGNVKSGNWRYSARLLTETFVGTDYLDLSPPVNVFEPSTSGNPTSIGGDNSGAITPKINLFTVTGIPSNVFKYIELIGVNYIDNTQVGYTLSRTLLSQNQTSIDLQHTGLETAVTSLDVGQLNVRGLGYVTAKNINAIDNRLILSNLTTGQATDFSDWTKTWAHTLLKGTVDFVGDPYGASFTANEYQLPANVYANLSFMANETYRLGAKFKLKNGTTTNVFWIDDIRIDTSSTNVTTPNRRISGLSNYDITDYDNGHVFYFRVQFDADLSTTIGGISARDLIDEIIIEQVEMTPQYQEILGSGVYVLGVEADDVSNTTEGFTVEDSPRGLSYKVADVALRIGQYFFITGGNTGLFPTYNPGPSFGNSVHAVAKRRHLSFYSPDLLYGYSTLTLKTGDKIVNFGNPLRAFSHIEASGTPHYSSSYAGYMGETTCVSPQISEAQQLQFLNTDQISIGEPGELYTRVLTSIYTGGGDVNTNTWVNKDTYVLYAGSNLTNIGAYADMGIYNGQYYQPKTILTVPFTGIYQGSPDLSKFGDRNLSIYTSTGVPYNVPTTGNAVININGDVFNQKTYLKIRFSNTSSGPLAYPMTPDGLGWDGGISFYSQNRVNTQMTNKRGPGSGWEFPAYPYQEWMEQGPAAANLGPNYNQGYNDRNSINADIAFDTSAIPQTDLPTRIIWSDLKPQDSLTDNFRKFLALNFKDLEPTFGEIMHHANGNGELITWQQRKFMRQYFNARGQLETNNNLNVIIGDGAVMSRNGQTLTVLGSKNKWGIIRGKSTQGNDTFYWINTEIKKIIRFGYDGTISLADIRGMQSFVANNLTWVDQFDTPADEFGICGFWDDRYAEAGWTVRARRIKPDWGNQQLYEIGDVVKLLNQPDGTFSTFEQIGDLYKSKTSHISSTDTEPETGADWQLNWDKIDQTDTNYFNEFTLIFNEFKNKFTAFYTPKPKIYLKWKDTYFSPRPAGNLGSIYLHNTGTELVWYDDGSTSQQEEGYLEGVINKNEEITKWYSAIDVDSQITPKRFDFKTKNHVSFLTEPEFENREDGSFSPIKCDSTATPTVNDNDITLLYGRWLKAKMTFEVGVYQKLIGFIVKFRNGARMFNK